MNRCVVGRFMVEEQERQPRDWVADITWGVLATIGVVLTFFTMCVPHRRFHRPHSKTKSDLMALHVAVLEYAIELGGQYPVSLEALLLPDEHGGPYLEMNSLPLDKWGRSYIYIPPSEPHGDADIYTLGSDGEPGGTGDDQDISVATLLGEGTSAP